MQPNDDPFAPTWRPRPGARYPGAWAAVRPSHASGSGQADGAMLCQSAGTEDILSAWSKAMKALKSDRARILLADPAARMKLRGYLESGVNPVGSVDRSVVIRVHSKSGAELRLIPVVVPKAA